MVAVRNSLKMKNFCKLKQLTNDIIDTVDNQLSVKELYNCLVGNEEATKEEFTEAYIIAAMINSNSFLCDLP